MSTTINLATRDQVKSNLSKWDDLSPLNEQQLKSILLLADLNQLQTASEESSSSLDTPKPSITTPGAGGSVILGAKDQLANKTSVGRGRGAIQEDINELLYNFDINDIEDPRIDRYVQSLQRNSRKCGQISDSIEAAFEHLGVLLENYEHVSQKTRSLHVACEQLLSDQVSSLPFFLILQIHSSFH